MQGTVIPMKKQLEIIKVTPEMAMELLESNTMNRPIQQNNVKRIVRQITSGKWRFNGDTIKISNTRKIVDGQHRLWAIIEANKAVETCIVYGVDEDAFATVDTLRKLRTGADILALNGVSRYRPTIAMALTWLLRYQRGILMDYQNPANKIEVSDIEEAFKNHPGMVHAAERAHKLRSVINPSICAFLYYVFNNHNPEIAERFVSILEEPNTGINDPFFRLRVYLTADHPKRIDALMTLALAIKAANAVYEGKKLSMLVWRYQAKNPEPFPTLAITNLRRKEVA